MLDRLTFPAKPRAHRFAFPALCVTAALSCGIWIGCAVETAWTSINRDLLADPAAYALPLHPARCGDVCIYMMDTK